jgi:hypothetical protein
LDSGSHDRPAHRDALALAAGKRLGLAQQQRLDIQDARRLVDAALDLGLGEFPQLQAERHVVEHAHVRIQRVVLEHHRDVAVPRWHIIDHVAIDPDLAVGDLL